MHTGFGIYVILNNKKQECLFVKFFGFIRVRKYNIRTSPQKVLLKARVCSLFLSHCLVLPIHLDVHSTEKVVTACAHAGLRVRLYNCNDF